jgi:hypothetical protein
MASNRSHGSLGALVAVVLLGVAAPPAAANPITIRPPDTGIVSVHVTYKDGSTAFASEGQDNGTLDEDPRLGYFKFTPTNQTNVDKVEVLSTGRFAAAPAINIYDFGVAGLDASPRLLPFLSTGGPTHLLAIIDVPALAALGTTLVAGTTLTAVNGSILISAIVLRDATSLMLDSDPLGALIAVDDPNVVAALPLFNGQVTVNDPLQVPEPSSLLLSAVVALALARRRMTCNS